MRGKSRSSRKNRISIFLHFLKSSIPSFLAFIAVLICNEYIEHKDINIPSFHFALSNLSNFIGLMVGFLFSFTMVILGFMYSKSLQIIFNNNGTKWQFLISLFYPTVLGFVTLISYTYIGAVLADDLSRLPRDLVFISIALIFDFMLTFLYSIKILVMVFDNIRMEGK